MLVCSVKLHEDSYSTLWLSHLSQGQLTLRENLTYILKMIQYVCVVIGTVVLYIYVYMEINIYIYIYTSFSSEQALAQNSDI